MKINPAATAANHQIKRDRDSVSVKAGGNKPTVGQVPAQEDQVKTSLNPNQKLMIGAKALMASLNKQLKLGDSISFEAHSKESVTIKDIQATQLDKIEVKPFEFDFEQVAKNVMDFVSGVILSAQANGASDDMLSEMLGQARSGVDKGFEMAREELKGFDIYTPELEEGIAKSYDLIHTGIDELEQQIFNPVSAKELEVPVAARRFDLLEQEQGTISISTRDGDNINIHFGNTMSLSQQQLSENGVTSHQVEFSNSHSFSLQIEGDLDKQEQKAVFSLIKDISKLADSFFSGNIEKAMEQAGKLGFNDQQIAQFSLDFKEVKQVSVLEHYAGSPNQSESPIATLAPYLKDLNTVVSQADALFKGDKLKQLMTSVAQQQIELMDDLLSQATQDFVDFNQRLLEPGSIS